MMTQPLMESESVASVEELTLDIVVVMPDTALGELLREALHRNLRWKVVANCQGAADMEVALRRETDSGLVIAEPVLGDAAGADVVERVRALRSRLPILLYTAKVDALSVEIMLRAGANGLIERGAPLSEFLGAVSKVARGETVFSSSVASVVRGFVRGPDGGGGRLTRRELEIGRRLVRGEAVDEVAKGLGLSPRTVINARRHIAFKLGIDHADRRGLPDWLR